jgi:hypothetical protein
MARRFDMLPEDTGHHNNIGNYQQSQCDDQLITEMPVYYIQ